MIRRIGRRRLLVVGIAVMGLVGAFVGGAYATHVFSDVPTNAFYHDDVTWLASKGVTAGCGGGKYCPNNAVTRGSMATFLHALVDQTRVDRFTCDPTGMVPYSSGQTWNNGVNYSTSSGFMACSVAVPHGATITKLSGVLFDSEEAANVSCDLLRRNLFAPFGNTSTMATIATSVPDLPGSIRVTDTTVANGQVDNDNYSYSVLCSGGSTFLGTGGMVVTYTYKGVPAP